MNTKPGAAKDAFNLLDDYPTEAEHKTAWANLVSTELEERAANFRDLLEMDPLFNGAFEEPTASPTNNDADVCTPEEASRLRRELREQGPAVFCERTVDAGRYTAKKLLSAFGIRPPAVLEGENDEAYFSLLVLAIRRELSKRAKLSTYNSLDDAVNLIQQSENIILLTGAGISTSLGIPDFRSKGTGLYSKFAHLGLKDPQEVFDIDVFKQDPTIFYSVAKDILPNTDRYTPTHKFIAMLSERGKLLTNYSQNIDNLEVKAGVPTEKLIQCHGSLGTATCVQCGYRMPGEKIFPEIKADKNPRCPRCIQTLRATGGTLKRKRSACPEGRRRRCSSDDSSYDTEYDIPTACVMKPDITFSGESLPDELFIRLMEDRHDKVAVLDLVIVIGTSLKLYISRQAVSHINFDIDLLGDCDVVVTELCRRLAWPLEHEMVPKGQKIDVTTEEGYKSRHVFQVRDAKESPQRQ
ncbi:DHS-like NAD/FAD-binding domain-containing protein [Ilyonectria destructans]|nr:DHS-like NAD/FAD-binding domain-containing protein [Ilyonectria destructans]